ncbi:MAG: hypothetical protein EXR77_01500 [Myxococcales bacterium]|nr:hypothetical protein [Myxococcales bacterium]
MRKLRAAGRFVYLVLVQAAVGFVWLAICGHLGINSPSAAQHLSRIASEALPGSFAIGGLRLTWTLDDVQLGLRLQARKLQVLDPAGDVVFSAAQLRARLALWPLLAGLQNDAVRLSLPELHLHQPLLALHNDAQGRLTLALAFADPDEPPSPKPKPFHLAIGEASLTDAHFDIKLPGIVMLAEQLGLTSPDLVVEAQPGRPVDVRYQLRDVVAARLHMGLESMQQLPTIPDASVQIGRVSGDLQQVALAALSLQMPPLQVTQPYGPPPHTVLAHSDISARWGQQTVTDGDNVLLATTTADPFVGALLGPLFAAQASMRGSFHFDDHRGFTTEGQVLARGKLSGFDTDGLRGHVAVHTGGLGAAAVRVVATDVAVAAYGGTLRSGRIDYGMPKDRNEHWLRTVLRVDHMRAEAALVSEAIGLKPLELTALLATGSLTGELGVATRTLLKPGLPVELDVALDADLALKRDAYLEILHQKLPTVRMVGGLRTTIDGAGALRMGMDQLHISADDEHSVNLLRLRADGLFDVAAGATDLDLSLDVPRLEAWLQPLGVANITGSLRLDNSSLGGQWRNPDVLGTLTMDNVGIAGRMARHLRCKLRMREGVVFFDGLTIGADFATLAADVQLGLFAKDIRVLRSSWPTEVRNATVERVELANLVPGFAGTGELRGGRFSLDAKNWAATIVGSADLTLHDVRVAGEALDRVSGQVSFGHGKASLVGGRIALRGGRSGGDDDIQVAGNYDLTHQTFSTEFEVPMLPFERLHAVAGQPLLGSMACAGRISGSLREFESEIGVQLRGLGWDKIKLGDGDFRLVKAKGGAMVLTAMDNLDFFDVQAGSELRFAGLSKLNEIALRLRTHGDIDPVSAAGLGKLSGLQAKLQGEVDILLDLRPNATLYRVDTQIGMGQLRVDFAGGHRLVNTSAAHVLVMPEKIELADTHFSMQRSEFEMCGAISLPKDGGPLTMAMFVAGAIDVPRSGAWAESLSDLDLRLDVLPDPIVAADPRSECLSASLGGRGRLRVAGPVHAPKIQGIVQTRAGKIALRKYPHDITIDEGGRVQIATMGSGGPLAALQLSIPAAHKLTMHIDNGTLKVDGRIGLKDLKIDTMELDFAGDELPADVPKQYSMRVSPTVRLSARNYYDNEHREWKARGRVVVTEGIYYRSFDRLSGVVGNAGQRRVDSYSRPLTESWPELADLQMELEILGTNFEVSSRFLLGKADLVTEFGVKVAGTLPAMRVYDLAKVTPGAGSQISYAINNLVFEVDRGNLNFTGDWLKPHMDLSLRTDIAVRAANRSVGGTGALSTDLSTDSAAAEEVVQVYVQIAGVYSENSKDFKIHLTSNKGDTEKDVQCLIVTRRRCGDAGASAPRLTTDMLFGEAINSVATNLLKTFVDTVAIDFDPANVGVTAEASKKFGKSIALGARLQTGREQRYTANFAFKITDRLSLNGLLRRERPVDAAGTQDAPVSVYESKLRYRVPLDD